MNGGGFGFGSQFSTSTNQVYLINQGIQSQMTALPPEPENPVEWLDRQIRRVCECW